MLIVFRNTKTNGYALSLNSGSSTNLTFDANGNMTQDQAGNRYTWDCENRLLSIVYPGSGNHSDFTYDPFGRNVKILEYTSISLTGTKQFVWDFGPTPREVRDNSSTLVSQYFKLGQMDTTNKRFFNLNQIGSVTEVTDNSGSMLGQFGYTPFGQQSQLQGSYVPDFGFSGYYSHARTGLNLTRTRSYSADLGRWINRDPIEEAGGVNLYAYVDNHPTSSTDPTGLFWKWLPFCKKRKLPPGMTDTDPGLPPGFSEGPYGQQPPWGTPVGPPLPQPPLNPIERIPYYKEISDAPGFKETIDRYIDRFNHFDDTLIRVDHSKDYYDYRDPLPDQMPPYKWRI